MAGDRSTLIPVDPFRERFLELRERGVSPANVARRLGWRHKGKRDVYGWDGRRVERTLGLKPSHDGRPNAWVEYDTAVKLCDALELDYVDVGV